MCCFLYFQYNLSGSLLLWIILFLVQFCFILSRIQYSMFSIICFSFFTLNKIGQSLSLFFSTRWKCLRENVFQVHFAIHSIRHFCSNVLNTVCVCVWIFTTLLIDCPRQNRRRHPRVSRCCCICGICSKRYTVRPAVIVVTQPVAVIRNQRKYRWLALDAIQLMHVNDPIYFCTGLCRSDATRNHPAMWKQH